ncbi:hypothetical protein J6590_005589 [Homalodisca vitripennis]|nr:hypothetical protein J6590_005589 [Homalodisca vitripennis]
MCACVNGLSTSFTHSSTDLHLRYFCACARYHVNSAIASSLLLHCHILQLIILPQSAINLVENISYKAHRTWSQAPTPSIGVSPGVSKTSGDFLPVLVSTISYPEVVPTFRKTPCTFLCSISPALEDYTPVNPN